jgi:hypothetical protein
MLDLRTDGVEILENFVENHFLEDIKKEIAQTDISYPKYGIRQANKKFKTIENLVSSSLLVDKASQILGSKPSIVRVIYFDKTQESNWLVPWHQDKTIALNKKQEIASWGRWSLKDGIHHVQPSVDVLDKMITFRIHLDDSDKENGCLKVIKNTHTRGILSHEEIQEIIQNEKILLCEVKAGDILLMRPHILHASSKSLYPKHRRIVHVEYSDYVLPKDLEWA